MGSGFGFGRVRGHVKMRASVKCWLGQLSAGCELPFILLKVPIWVQRCRICLVECGVWVLSAGFEPERQKRYIQREENHPGQAHLMSTKLGSLEPQARPLKKKGGLRIFLENG